MRKTKISPLKKILLAGLIGTSSHLAGCNYNLPKNYEQWQPHQIQWENYDENMPFIAMFEGWNGPWPKYMHIMAKNIEEELNAPVYVTDVHFWKENMENIREAYRRGREIMLAGFSAGAHQAYLAAKQCEKERIPIRKIVFYDPTYTNDHKLYIPDNVYEIEAVFSSDKSDWLAFARGKKGNIIASERIVRKIRDTEGGHLGAFTWERFKNEWMNDIQQHLEIQISKNK